MQNEIDIDLSARAEGHFEMRAVNSVTGEERELASFHNLILDSGFAYWLGDSGAVEFIGECQVGAGSTPPAPGQSALVSRIASTNGVQSDEVLPDPNSPYSIRKRVTYRFPAGWAAGNVAEVGVGWGPSGNTLFSRALVLDANGNPTTVTVLSDEFLDVTYTFTVFPQLADAISTLNINGQSYTVTVRPAQLGTRNGGVERILKGAPMHTQDVFTVGKGPLAAVTSQPDSVGSASGTTLRMRPYEPGSLYAEGDMTMPITAGNIGGIANMLLQPRFWHSIQVGFDPMIPKTETQVFRFRLRIQMARR